MKKIVYITVIAIVAAASILWSCQKDEIFTKSTEGLILKSIENCGTCVSDWSDTKDTIYFSSYNLSIIAEQNRTELTNLTLYRASGFTKLTYDIIFHDVSENTDFTLVSLEDASASGGSVTSRNLLKNKDQTAYLSVASFPSTWEACDYVVIKLKYIGGVGFPNNGDPVSVNYYLRELCTSTSLIADVENPVCVGDLVILTANVSASEEVVAGTLEILDADNNVVATGTNSASFEYTPTEPGSVNFHAVYSGAEGFASSISEDVVVEAVNCGGCEEYFSYYTEDSLSVIFKYVSDTLVENGTMNFTCPHITNFVSNDGKIYTVNNVGNNTVLSWNGNFEPCDTVSFNITFIPDCTKVNNGNGTINICTDFKLNENSLKEITPPEGKTSWPNLIYGGCE